MPAPADPPASRYTDVATSRTLSRDGDGGVRTLVARWDDPSPVQAHAPGMSGLELLQAIGEGALPAPPLHHVLGIEAIEASPGRMVFAFTPQEYHYNPMGIVHGGVAATVLDSAMGCAVNTELPAGTGYTTLDLQVRYLRAATVATGPLRAEAQVVHRGSRVATAEGRLLDGRGRLVATATTTCLLMPRAAETSNGAAVPGAGQVR